MLYNTSVFGAIQHSFFSFIFISLFSSPILTGLEKGIRGGNHARRWGERDGAKAEVEAGPGWAGTTMAMTMGGEGKAEEVRAGAVGSR